MDRNLAYATVLGLADSAEAFQMGVEEAASRLGFDLLELEEAEPLRIREASYEVPSDALRLAKEVAGTGVAKFGTLFTWTSE